MIFAWPYHSSPPLLFSSLLLISFLFSSYFSPHLSFPFSPLPFFSSSPWALHTWGSILPLCCIFELLISYCSSLTDICDFISGAGIIVSYVTFSCPLHQSTSFLGWGYHTSRLEQTGKDTLGLRCYMMPLFIFRL